MWGMKNIYKEKETLFTMFALLTPILGYKMNVFNGHEEEEFLF